MRGPQTGPQVAGGAELERDLGFFHQPREIAIGHCHRAAVDVERNVGLDRDQVIGPDAREPGIEEPPVCTVVTMPCLLAQGIIGPYSYGVFNAPKPALASHTPCAMSSKSLSTRPGLHDHRAGMDPHAAGAEILETFMRGDGQRLHAGRSFGRPGTCTSDALMAVVVPPCV